MRTMPKPAQDPKATFMTCISRILEGDLKTRLESVAPNIEAAAKVYDTAASATSLYRLPLQPNVGNVTCAEMRTVYTSRMVPKNSPGRPIYDKLVTSPTNGRCPLCAHRAATTLDHYLPESQFAALTVLPWNLVPACKDCNTAKNAAFGRNEDEQTLHPYYDNVDVEQWLFAEVVQSVPAAVRFVVVAPLSWDKLITARVNHHFRFFGLNSLYAANAAEEMSNIQFHLRGLHARLGLSGVAAYLQEMAASRWQAHRNSWQTAAYQALAASNWFCDGGFG